MTTEGNNFDFVNEYKSVGVQRNTKTKKRKIFSTLLKVDEKDEKGTSLCIRKGNICNFELLHPDWRQVPHLYWFGWTEKHSILERHLRNEMLKGNLSSMMYFKNVEEYTTTSERSPTTFLPGPTVNTVEGILRIISENMSTENLSKSTTTTTVVTANKTESDYDADDESLKPLLITEL